MLPDLLGELARAQSLAMSRLVREGNIPQAKGSADGKAGSRADYTVKEVAQRHNRSGQTVRDWIKSGQLEAYRFNGREYRVTPEALAEFERQQRGGHLRSGGPTDEAVDLGAWRKVQSIGCVTDCAVALLRWPWLVVVESVVLPGFRG